MIAAFKLFDKSNGGDEYRARDAMDLNTYRKIKYYATRANKENH